MTVLQFEKPKGKDMSEIKVTLTLNEIRIIIQAHVMQNRQHGFNATDDKSLLTLIEAAKGPELS